MHRPLDGDVVDLDAGCGEQLLDLAVGQAQAQLPADGQNDHVGWEAEAAKGDRGIGSRARAARTSMPRDKRPNVRDCNAAAPSEGPAKDVEATLLGARAGVSRSWLWQRIDTKIVAAPPALCR